MSRVLHILLGTTLLVVTLSLMMVSGWVATFTHDDLSSSDREHLEAAVQFVRQTERASGALPSSQSFDSWARGMDGNGHFRFEGRAYSMNARCSSEPSEFCINFWTGDDFATYRSWRDSMDRVLLDESPYPLSAGILIAALLTGLGGLALIAKRAKVNGVDFGRAGSDG